MAESQKALKLDQLHSGAARTAVHEDAIERALFNRIMSNHRVLPLLFPLVGILIIATLTTTVSNGTVVFWAVAVLAVWAEIAFFSMRYFAGKLAPDARRLSTALALRYLNANIVWSSMLILYWSPTNTGQDFFLLLLFVAHLSIATATTAYEWRIYFACTLPITAAVVTVCLQSGEPIYMAVGGLVFMVYGFMLTVTKQVIAQAQSAIALRLEHDDLIRDLAKAKSGSDIALRGAEAANTRLMTSERRFRALVDNAFDGIAIVSDDGNIQFATEAVARMFDTTPDRLHGTHLTKLCTEIHADEVRDALTELASKPGEKKSLAVWAATFSGRKIWIETSACNMLHDESVNGVVLNVRDATARMNADSELKMHLCVLEKLATSATMEAVLTDLTVTMEELKTGMRATILLIDDDNCLRVAAAPSMPQLYRDIYDGMPADEEVGPCGCAAVSGERTIMADTNTHPAFVGREEAVEALNIGSAWSHPIHSRDGRVLGSITMVYSTPQNPSADDLKFLGGAAQMAALAVERRRAEQRLAEALRTAEIANHSKSQFLANMSHELRTPLNAIIGFSEMIREEMFGPVGASEYVEYISDIHSSGRHLLELINDILDISKIEAGQFEIDESWIDLPVIANWSTDLIRHRAQENDVSLIIDIADNIHEAYVDERALKQILLNLLSNATKFTREGGHVILSAHMSEDKELLLAVSDTGIGIESHLIERVLEPFAQAEGPMARSFGGTGLGLPITKSLVELHGGSMKLESEAGVGTTVTVCLPKWRVTREGPNHQADDQAQSSNA